jgi:DNA-binding protein H-NS
LIQADLDHARHVMALWSDQVVELEKALEQIDAVGDSRAALRGEHQEQQGRAPALTTGNGLEIKAKRGRKPKLKGAASNAEVAKPKKQRAAQSSAESIGSKAADRAGSTTDSPGKTGKKRALKKIVLSGVAKYQDPDTGKTWTGHGRRPRWMVGAPETYLIEGRAGHQAADTALQGGSTDTPPESRATA